MTPLVIPSGDIHVFESRDAWLEDRRQSRFLIGGSIVGQILGLRPFGKTQWDAFVALQPGSEPEGPTPEVPARFARGLEWEKTVLDRYATEVGMSLGWPPGAEPPRVLQVRNDWQGSTPDGFAWSEETGWGGVEAKTSTLSADWGPSGTIIERWTDDCSEIVPPYYACQCYWYMDITGLPFWDLAVLIPAGWSEFPELRWYRLLRDEETQTEIREAVATWRQKHLIEGEPPEVDESDAAKRWLQKTHPGPQKGEKRVLREASAEETALIAEFSAAREREEQAKAEKESARNRLMLLIGDDYGLRYAGGKRKALWFPSTTRPEVKMDVLRERFPDAYEECVVPGHPIRVFRTY